MGRLIQAIREIRHCIQDGAEECADHFGKLTSEAPAKTGTAQRILVKMKRVRKNSAGPKFLNVDLDIESKHDLAPLEAELGEDLVNLYEGLVTRGHPKLRLEFSTDFNNPDETICAFCSLLERLSAKGKRAWRDAHKKEFNIGYDADRRERVSQFSLRAETLKRVAGLSAMLGVTFYYLDEKWQKAPGRKPTPKRKSK
jgi:hypothetical protein